MGSASMVMVVTLFAAAVIMSTVEAGSGSCPLPSKVYSCNPKCVQDYDCTHGKVCCPNSCNAKSCTESAAYGAGAGGDKYSQSGGGSGIYCGNVKCSSFEKCILDPTTKRQKCGRA